jgi:hypothetical protein
MNNMPYIPYPGYAEGITEANEENLLRAYPELGGSDLNEAPKSVLRDKYGFGFIRKHFGDFLLLNLKGFAGEISRPLERSFYMFDTNVKNENHPADCTGWFCVFLYITYLLFLLSFVVNIRSNRAINIGTFIMRAYLSIPRAIYTTPRFRDPFFPLILLSAIYNSPVLIRLFCSKTNIPQIKRAGSYLLDRQSVQADCKGEFI